MRFKKIASVFASAVMLSSTVGLAAATMYPQPFVSEGGSANVAIVYGSHPAALNDLAAAVNVQDSLNTYVVEDGVSTPVDADCEGETCVYLGKSNDKINLGDITWPLGTNIDKDDLAILLADGEYVADDNDDFEYEQSITLGAKTFDFQRDSNYEDVIGADERTPFLGFKYSDGNSILNYTLDFLQDAESTVTDGDLDDFEGSTMTLFGKDYYISDAANGTTAGTFGKFTLLDAANTALVSEGDVVTVTVDGETYEVSAQIFSSTEVILTINGERTDTLNEGQTQKLSDGSTYVGVKDILYVSKDTGISSVEFSIGAGKIEITSGQEIKINDKTIEGVYGYFHRGTASGATQKLDKVTIEWKSEDESFVTPESSITMPGMGGLKLSMDAWVRPTEEEIVVENDGGQSSASTGGAGIALKVPLKDGNADISLLYSNQTGQIKGIGKSSTERLATTSGTELIFRNKMAGEDYHKYVVVSYNTTDEAESYLISFNMNEDTDAGRNETTVKNEVTGDEIASDQTTGLFDTGIGSASFTINSIGVNSTDEWVNITAGTNTHFNTLYTDGGLAMWLPYEDSSITVATTSFTQGQISFADADVSSNTTGHNLDSFYLYMDGEDKDDNIAAGDYIYLTINENADDELEVTAVSGLDLSSELETGDSTKIYESYSKDETAVRIQRDSGGDPDSATVYYPEGNSESYAEVFLSAVDAVLGGGPTGGVGVPVTDAEASAYSGKNLVVVGGSCVNSVAAELISNGDTTALCGSDWTAVTGVGMNQYLIQTFSRTGGKVATLVAGYSMGDTANAANALTTTDDLDTSAGMKYTGSTVEDIEPVLSSA